MNDTYNFTSLQQPMSGQGMGQGMYYDPQQFGMAQGMNMPMNMGGMPNGGMNPQFQSMINNIMQQGYMAQGITPTPQMMGMGFEQQKIKIPPPTTKNVQGFIAMQLQMPVELIEFVALSEPFFSEGTIRHACKLALLQIEHLKCCQVQYFDKAMLDVAYCPNCIKVYYYIEKYDY